MSGNVIFDTNIIIYLSKKLLAPEKVFFENANYSISVISKMELLGFAFKNKDEENFILELIDSLYVVPLTEEIVDATIKLRKLNKIKLPDAIVYATAQVVNGKLITNNIADFYKIISNVELINPL
ncbi:type II toxin-antitoxin system VapC family toxin [Pedobacter fastidiosus]|uniref:Type II toxin-antitoxin system VapC family toxin n=1 Tax=Pedobacter fastidiosus TaxID=2765361 RepID=A0ABR7KP03_9SPHI|nr:type II toxin-antitoxin system VapC family toxin [Pedobacter fastidiosus]MBC6109814.1 type II toxin-antitoxin system VapC family toxin [Pedobacter fastidiosus]